MTEQLRAIIGSSNFLKNKFPRRFRPEIAIISENNFEIFSGVKILDSILMGSIPPVSETNSKYAGRILFARAGGRDVIVCNGRFHYYDGFNMREIGHIIYMLKYAGVKKIISFDEVGLLNPRFATGELALIYDQINLIGDNPLIGKNDPEIGLRFPDMSNAYSKSLYEKIFMILQKNYVKINDSVYLGTAGPQSETDAEARFYREIGADVVGYSVVPENIAAVHAGVEFAAIGLITHDLVADKMMEDQRNEKQRNKDQKLSLSKSEHVVSKILGEIIKAL